MQSMVVGPLKHRGISGKQRRLYRAPPPPPFGRSPSPALRAWEDERIRDSCAPSPGALSLATLLRLA